MKNFKEFIPEIKSTIDPDRWVWTKTSNSWAVFLPAHDLTLLIYKSKKAGAAGDVWFVSFDVGGHYVTTGTGSSKIIFAWVIERIIEFIKVKKPNVISYSATKSEQSRVDAYKRMTRIVSRKIPNYIYVNIGAGKGKGYPFYIVRKDLLKQDIDVEDELITHNNMFA
tara:strand:+ start:9910 stop:10410 length:501 start_codon:yes stop_codon:yes gene_type:complete